MLLEQLANRTDCAQIHVQRGDLSITLQKAQTADLLTLPHD